ncbi:hypothetical protein [Nocardia sp. CA-119907]|uniref:hypothetical protein n=1 Tax=Nocardia sp. CA-119907 TaxID=3239973 RepID=UPI003D993BC2
MTGNEILAALPTQMVAVPAETALPFGERHRDPGIQLRLLGKSDRVMSDLAAWLG